MLLAHNQNARRDFLVQKDEQDELESISTSDHESDDKDSLLSINQPRVVSDDDGESIDTDGAEENDVNRSVENDEQTNDDGEEDAAT
jgi:hypothetical protein